MSQGFTQLSPEDPEFIGGWKLTGRVGHGGFGTIYVGTKDGLTAAIKLISRDAIDNQDSIPRFANEVRSLKKLNHPGIPKLIEHNLNRITPSILPFIAVEYFEGETFQSYLDQNKPINEQLWLEYLKSLIEILIYCHDKGIIHRDISPSNIIVTKDGPKLIDFGFSYLKGSERLSQIDAISQIDVIVGTPPFRSPEHYVGEPIDAMDVFSLASVFVFIANGTYPFIAEQESRSRDKILHDAPGFQGMSENQKSLLTPLFYKDPEARPALKDITQGIAELQFTKQLNTYRSFLKNSDKKLRKHRQNNLATASIARLLSIVFIALISIVGLISLLSRQSVPNEVRSGLTRDSVVLTSDQLTQLSACKDFATLGDEEAAIKACREIAELGDAWAQYSLGISLKKPEDVEFWIRKAADQKLPEALVNLAYIEIDRKNYSKALALAQQAADSGSLDGVNAVGVSYGYLKQYDLAIKWYKKSWELGDVLGAINLGFHYRFDSYDKNEAAKWLKIAAETKSEVFEGETAFAYADFLRIEMKNDGEACKWYKKSANAQYKEDGKDGVAAFKKFCSSNKASPNPVKSALASSEELNLSPPLDRNVKISNIFGRVFKDSEMMWRIILTNSSEDPVPPINGIQFRLIGYEDAGWIGLPYKLKRDLQFNTVYAVVDDLFFAVLFKKPVCPEFRAVREEGGKLVNIWTKGQPECSNDYVP